VHQAVNGLQLSSNVELLDIISQHLDRRVFLISTKDLVGLLVLVWSIDVVDCEDGEIAVVTKITKDNACRRLDAIVVDILLGDVEADGHGEEVAISETVVLYNADGEEKC